MQKGAVFNIPSIFNADISDSQNSQHLTYTPDQLNK